MKKNAYKQYLIESDNWLHRGRRFLLETCLCYFARHLLEKKNLRVLEIGAGSGKNIEALSKFGAVEAIEIEPLAIETLKSSRHLRRLLINKVPFQLNQKYDIICAMDFLEHVENDVQVFRWMEDHLEYDGVMFITVPAYQFLFSYHDIALGHLRRYRLNRLVTVNNDKLLIIKKGYFNFFLFPLVFISRMSQRIKLCRIRSQLKQSSTVHPFFDRFFFKILKTEAKLIRKYPLFPYGLTAFALFKNCKMSSAPGPIL